jgi:WD40 repeat protein
LLRGHQDAVSCLAFTPDGKTVISGSRDGTVRLWDVAKGSERKRLSTPGYLVRSLALSGDGNRLAAGYELRLGRRQPLPRGWRGNPVRLWDLPSLKERTTRARHIGPVNALAFSRDGQTIATSSMDSDFYLWKVSDGKMLREVKPAWMPGTVVQAMSFSPTGDTLACGCSDNQVYLVDPRKPKLARLRCYRFALNPAPLAADESWPRMSGVLSLAYSGDGRSLVAGSADQAVRLWDVPTASERTFGGHRGAVSSIAVSPDGKLLASSGQDNAIRLWDARTGEQLNLLYQTPAGWDFPYFKSLAFSPDGKSLAAAAGCYVALWEVATRRLRWWTVWSADMLRFSPDGKTLLLTSPMRHDQSRLLSVRDASTGRQLRTRSEPQGGTWLSVSPGGDLAVCWTSKDQTWRLVETTGGKEVGRIGKDAGLVRSLAFSPDGKVLAGAVGAFSFRVWEARTGRELHRFTGRADGAPVALALSPNNRLLASAGRDRTVRLWNVRTGKEVTPPLTGHQALTSCLLFTPDGKRLVSGSEDGTMLVWDVTRWSRPEAKAP